jgi:3-deoxy-D-manno-octulosonic-acid transferase
MTRWWYGLLMWLAQPLLLCRLKYRGKKEAGYLQAIPERFGRYKTVRPPCPLTVWIHAVSLGETRAAAMLIAALRSQLPTMRLLLTHGTATGRHEGVKCLQAGDVQAWQPWDTPGAVQRFLDHFKPNIGILMETEIWPNLVHACQKNGVPLMLANARLSEPSMQKAKRLSLLARPAFAALTAVWAQTPDDAKRLSQLGAPVRGVLGNLKFDATPDAAQLVLGRQWRRSIAKPIVMLASSREGEELALLKTLVSFCPITHAQPTLVATNLIVNQMQWLIVPRHPQRFDAVANLIESQGFRVSRRSLWKDDTPDASSDPSQPCIWLGDSLGEMALYYGMADVALLGGSFEPLGGQNLIEAAACACPLIMGPHTFNFEQAAQQAQAASAAFRATDFRQALSLVHALVTDTAQLKTASQAAFAFAQTNKGATERLAREVVQLLGASDD